jgi:hypothetical protein
MKEAVEEDGPRQDDDAADTVKDVEVDTVERYL